MAIPSASGFFNLTCSQYFDVFGVQAQPTLLAVDATASPFALNVANVMSSPLPSASDLQAIFYWEASAGRLFMVDWTDKSRWYVQPGVIQLTQTESSASQLALKKNAAGLVDIVDSKTQEMLSYVSPLQPDGKKLPAPTSGLAWRASSYANDSWTFAKAHFDSGLLETVRGVYSISGGGNGSCLAAVLPSAVTTGRGVQLEWQKCDSGSRQQKWAWDPTESTMSVRPSKGYSTNKAALYDAAKEYDVTAGTVKPPHLSVQMVECDESDPACVALPPPSSPLVLDASGSRT